MIFLTGATGFVGSALLTRLIADKADVTALVRSESVVLSNDVMCVIGDLGIFSDKVAGQTRNVDILSILRDVDVVIHAAARAHIMRDDAIEPLAEYRKINRDSTLALACLAAEAGVKRFVFMSSIGVNGNQNMKPFTERHEPHAYNAYSMSKFEAEQGLLKIA